MQRITSAHNPRLREAARLIHSSRDRRKSGKCVLEGEHLIAVYVERVGMPESVIVSDEALRRPQTAALVERLAHATLVVSSTLLAELASLPPGVGIIAVVANPEATPGGPDTWCVLLEEVQDPGNVGSILRTCAAAGVDRVLLSKGCAFAWSPKVLRAAQGAHFAVAIEEAVDLAAWCERYRARGGNVVASVVHGGVSIYEADLGGRMAFAIGNEGGGLSEALMAYANTRVTIPMPGAMESLNAAAATAVCVFEAVRQRSRGEPTHRRDDVNQ